MSASARLPRRAQLVFHAIATTVVPEVAGLAAAEWDELEGVVARAVAARPARLQRQLRVLLQLLEWLPVLRYGHRLSSLDVARRTRVLELMQRAPVLLLRRGLWGVRTLVLMGYYGRAAAAAAIGYRADPRGWERRR
ncbi:MAG TPA: hypothetical protein VJN39_07345 [Gemmatimonadales bacterium]|nr:hypothetical protein [Gemmatimonadales bacterium]